MGGHAAVSGRPGAGGEGSDDPYCGVDASPHEVSRASADHDRSESRSEAGPNSSDACPTGDRFAARLGGGEKVKTGAFEGC